MEIQLVVEINMVNCLCYCTR